MTIKKAMIGGLDIKTMKRIFLILTVILWLFSCSRVPFFPVVFPTIPPIVTPPPIYTIPPQLTPTPVPVSTVLPEPTSTPAPLQLSPGALDGKVYELTIVSGAGIFAVSGKTTLSFQGMGYVTSGDDKKEFIAQDKGKFFYEKTGVDTASFILTSSMYEIFTDAVYLLQFSTSSRGTFTATMGEGHSQTGEFLDVSF